MGEVLLWIGGVLVFVVVLMVSVGLHEAGHMVAAKKLGLRVPAFFIGFGKKVFSFKRGETEYGVRALPLGGYVRILDKSDKDMDDEERAMLSNVAPWKRQIVFAAGPLVNVALGFVILVSYLMIVPMSVPNTTVDEVNACSAEETVCGAREANILAGDEISKIDGTVIEKHEDISAAIGDKSAVDVVVLRDGVAVGIGAVSIADSRLGVNVGWDEEQRDFFAASSEVGGMIGKTVSSVLSIPAQIPELVGAIFGMNERDPESVGSVVGAGRAYGDVAASDRLEVSNKISFMVLAAGGINLSLGFINFLPLMPLDGGRMLIAAADSVRLRWAKMRAKDYSPTSMKFIRVTTALPAVLVFGTMLIMILADIFSPISILG